jgi:hypothetical protein
LTFAKIPDSIIIQTIRKGHLKMMYQLRSIDAWRYDGNWEWNNSFLIEENIYLADDTTPRELFKFMRRNGWLTDYSKGRVFMSYNGDIIEIQDRNNYQPLFAFIPEV